MPRSSNASSPGRKLGGPSHTELAGELVMIDGDPQIYLVQDTAPSPEKKNPGRTEETYE